MMCDLVLVTGGAGFIGSHTVDRLLREGYSVRILDRLHPQVHANGTVPAYLSADAEFLIGDVRDLAAVRRALRGVSQVIHLAAETSVGQSMYEGDVHVDVNARGTAILFRAIREEGVSVRSVVIASSRAVYGEGAYSCDRCGQVSPGQRSIDDLEAHHWVPRCPICSSGLTPVATDEGVEPTYSSSYGMTKLFQEQISQLEATQLGHSLAILRYFNVYGCRQSPHNPYTGLITTLALRVLAGRPLVLYECGSPLRDFVHVDDVAWANVRALTADLASPQTINIGSGRSVTLVELAAALARAFDSEPQVELSTRFRVGDIHASIAAIEQARRVLGYEPRVPIDAGLHRLVPWLQSKEWDDRSDAVETELRSKGVLRGDQPNPTSCWRGPARSRLSGDLVEL